MSRHSTLTDPALHECKGAAAATLGQVLTAQGDGTAIFDTPASGGSGSVVKSTTTNSTTLLTSTTLTPFDNTIPQVSEGLNVFTSVWTPAATGNKIRVEATIFGAYSVAAHVTASLYQDAVTNAVAACAQKVTAANDGFTLKLTYEFTAASTSATTFKVNIGGSTAGTVTVNGNAGGAWFGGVAMSSLVITETKA